MSPRQYREIKLLHSMTEVTDLELILSHPTAIPTSISPLLIESDTLRIAMRPDEQSLLIACAGVVSGNPAVKAAARDSYAGEGGWHVPTDDIPLFSTQ